MGEPKEQDKDIDIELIRRAMHIIELREALQPFVTWCEHIMATGSRRLEPNEVPELSGIPRMEALYNARKVMKGKTDGK